jgi:hypothetical protein
MNTNWEWNAPARPVFRVFAGILGAGFTVFGALPVFLRWLETSVFNPARPELAMLGCGIVFFTVAARGRVIKKDIG